jgi:DNA sulfur modification protein DndD
MILETVSIENVGVYGGRAEFNLNPLSAEKPVVLIGGLNGRGKTTLRNAILTCFHGDNAVCTNRDNLPYRQYLSAIIHKKAAPDAVAAIEVTYRRQLAGKTQRIRIRRSWWRTEDGAEERFEAFPSFGSDALQADVALATNWPEHIESYFPAALANLFIFDGDDIARLTKAKEIQKLLTSALESLLGIGLVRQLEADLARYLSSKAKETASSEVFEKLRKVEELVTETQMTANQRKEELSVANEALSKAEKLAKDASDAYLTAGGKLLDESGDLTKAKAEMDARIEQLMTEVQTLNAGMAPLCLIEELLSQVAAQADAEEAVRVADLIREREEERDLKTLAKLAKATGVAEAEIRKILESTRSKTPKGVARVLGADSGLAPGIHHAITERIPAERAKAAELLTQISRVQEALASLDKTLANVPDADAIHHLKEAREIAEMAILSARAHQSQARENFRLADLHLTRAANQKASIEHENLMAKREMTELGIKIERAAQARDTLRSFREASLRNNLERVGLLIEESFRRLIGKVELLSHISVNTEDLTFELKDKDGRTITHAMLSKGEQQILAYATLWGLGRASGRPLPVIVDTPLARLDLAHKRNVVERYFYQAAHQVIILSTDSEITPEFLELLNPSLSRKLSLEFNDTHQSTTVVDGYFSQR